MNFDASVLHEAIYNQIVVIVSENLAITQHELESILRSDLEKAMKAALKAFIDEGYESGYVEEKIMIGDRIYSKEEFADMFTKGISHPNCMSPEKLSEGLQLYFEHFLSGDFSFFIDLDNKVNIIYKSDLLGLIEIDSKKVAIRKFPSSDLADEIIMTSILPVVLHFIEQMKDIHKIYNKEKDAKDDDDSDPFEWI